MTSQLHRHKGNMSFWKGKVEIWQLSLYSFFQKEVHKFNQVSITNVNGQMATTQTQKCGLSLYDKRWYVNAYKSLAQGHPDIEHHPAEWKLTRRERTEVWTLRVRWRWGTRRGRRRRQPGPLQLDEKQGIQPVKDRTTYGGQDSTWFKAIPLINVISWTIAEKARWMSRLFDYAVERYEHEWNFISCWRRKQLM